MRSNNFVRQSLIFTSVLAALGSVAHAQQGYEVVEIETLPGTVQSDARAINEQGHAVGVSNNILNQNIRLDLLDPERFDGIDDFEDLTLDEITFIRNQLNSVQNLGPDPAFQKLATELGFYFDGQLTNLTTPLDINDPETGELTDSVDLRTTDLNNAGWVVGRTKGPFTRIEGTDAAEREMFFFAWEQFPMAVATNGQTYTMLPGEDGLYFGGTSGAFAVNDNNVVVGYASVSSNEEMDAYYTRCTNPERVDEDGNVTTVGLEPLPVCMWRLWYQNEPMSSSRQAFFTEQAYLWQLDDHGELLERRALGVAFDADEDAEADEFETLMYRSLANDINNETVAVGTSYRLTDAGTYTRATVFDAAGDPQRPMQGHEFEDRSQLITINEQGIAVGFISRVITQFNRNRLFWIDTNTPGAEPEFPAGFFPDSGWLPRDINNHNQIVGRADTENTLEAVRRTAGFMYELDTGRMINLNDLLPCDSGYWIFDAKSINDSGEILATALTDISVDVGADEPFEGSGARAVILRPTGEQTGCVDPEDQENVQNERKGAAASPVMLFLLSIFALITIRRKFIR